MVLLNGTFQMSASAAASISDSNGFLDHQVSNTNPAVALAAYTNGRTADTANARASSNGGTNFVFIYAHTDANAHAQPPKPVRAASSSSVGGTFSLQEASDVEIIYSVRQAPGSPARIFLKEQNGGNAFVGNGDDGSLNRAVIHLAAGDYTISTALTSITTSTSIDSIDNSDLFLEINVLSNKPDQGPLVTLDQLKLIMPNLSTANALRYIGPLNDAMREFGINTPKRVAAFLSQVAFESFDLNGLPISRRQSDVGPWEENYTLKSYSKNGGTDSYTATSKKDFFNHWYQNKNGNGDYDSDDGYDYRGRGPFQLTGYDNYEKYGKIIGMNLGLVVNPDLVADYMYHPEIGLRVSAAFFSDKRLALGPNNSTGQYILANSSIDQKVLRSSMLEIAEAVNVNDLVSVNDVNLAITYGVNGGLTAAAQRLLRLKVALKAMGFTGDGLK